MSFARLIEKITQLNNPTVAGLDPSLDFIPEYIKKVAFDKYGETLEGAAAAILEFNKGLIDALYTVVPAIKPQCAYYEMYGWQGVKALHDTICYAKQKGMFVITDGKRNDIGTTMEAYSVAHLGKIKVGSAELEPFGADALTVNGYLGSDGIKPLLKECEAYDKGIFVLVKTSNRSSGELQDQEINGQSIYQLMGMMCDEWGKKTQSKYGYNAVGAVVGATFPKQLKQLREMMPNTFFLVPGYGAQGGNAKDVALAFDRNGLGAIINSSRAIMCAYKKEGCKEQDYAAAARREAEHMRDEILSSIPKIKI
jgi:orotidine-5'-phosphate decarboxylase